MSTPARVGTFLKILRDLDIPITESTKVLDLGCGAGGMVQEARNKGLQFYGCGFALRDDDYAANQALIENGFLRTIKEEPYTLPFDDGFFDVVISDQVFEHVMDYPTTLRETQRVLKPGGKFLHVFPSRYSVLEPHLWVPFGGMMQSRPWLMLWALLGVRNRFQKDLSAAETVEANKAFLTTHTNYLPKRELRRLFGEYYTDVEFVEQLFLKQSRRGNQAYRLSKVLPFLPKIYSAARCRVMTGRRPAVATQRNETAETSTRRSDAFTSLAAH